jgi:hypothetical protein
MKILSGKWATSRGMGVDISAAAYEARQLGYCKNFLQPAYKLASVKKFLERAPWRKQSVSILSVLRIFVRASVQQSRNHASKRGGSVQIPGTVTLAAAGGLFSWMTRSTLALKDRSGTIFESREICCQWRTRVRSPISEGDDNEVLI